MWVKIKKIVKDLCNEYHIYPTPELFRHHFCKALMEYGEVFVYVNGTKQGVELPERFKWDSYLPLNSCV